MVATSFGKFNSFIPQCLKSLNPVSENNILPISTLLKLSCRFKTHCFWLASSTSWELFGLHNQCLLCTSSHQFWASTPTIFSNPNFQSIPVNALANQFWTSPHSDDTFGTLISFVSPAFFHPSSYLWPTIITTASNGQLLPTPYIFHSSCNPPPLSIRPVTFGQPPPSLVHPINFRCPPLEPLHPHPSCNPSQLSSIQLVFFGQPLEANHAPSEQGQFQNLQSSFLFYHLLLVAFKAHGMDPWTLYCHQGYYWCSYPQSFHPSMLSPGFRIPTKSSGLFTHFGIKQ